MIVERRIVQPNNNNKFPVGMRILAVDDDPICLKLLQSLLRKCQYHVTTRDRAIDALNLLRENRDEFDLVISDVHMPDMDGFKLLELVGLEMDLPVIMLSANGDTKLVMKGITHGACDYLLKPVRLEELQNIWQHVIRKTSEKRSGQSNTDNRDKRSSGQAHQGQQQGGGGRSTNVDQDSRIGKRRKEPVEVIDEEENDENNNDDPSQKKARVVWSVELHRKFVAAVNQLGFEGAVPKKILELMNVEKLTRENVASHLQKYRLYLKRLSSVANQQAHMVAALGGADSSLMHMHSLNFHNFNTSAAAQFHTNNSLRSLPPSGVLSGRLNSSYNLGFNGLSPSRISPLSPTHLTSRNNPLSDPSKLHPEVVLGGDQNSTNVLQGMPTSLEFDQIHNLQLQQHNKKGGFVGRDFSCSSSVCDTPGVFPNGYLDSKRNLTSSSSRSSTLPNSSLQLFQSQECKNTRAQGHYGTHQHQSSSSMSMSVVPFDSTSSFSLPDQTQCDGVWAGGIPNQTNHHLPLTTSYTPPGSVDMRKNGSCSTGLSSGLDHSRFNLQQQQQTVLIGDNNNSMAGYSLDQKLDMSDIRAGYNVNSSMLNSSMVSHPVLDASAEQSLDMNGSSLFQGNNSGFGSMSQAGLDTSLVQLTLPEISATSDLNRGYLAMQHARTMGSFSENVGSLEDVVNSMNRWEESGTALKRVGELGSDVYPMRTCI